MTTSLIEQSAPAKGVLKLSLNDSSRRNALSEAMLLELNSILEESKENSSIACLIIAANGPAFCAGHDLKEIHVARQHQDEGKAFFSQLFTLCAKVMQNIVNHPKPIIAEVAGIATAAGCQLVASCDLAIASEQARFATPGVHIGLFCSTPMVALSRNIAHKHAMEMLLTGDPIDANKAFQFGLINQIVEAEELEEKTLAVAIKIAQKSKSVLKIGKAAFYQQSAMPVDKAYEYTAQVMVENMLDQSAKEGIGAFLEKRPPQWD